MRGITRLLIVVGIVIGVVGRAGGEEPAPQAPAYTPPTQSTTVKGTAPALEGRWLLVTRIAISTGPGRATASLWEVSRKDGQLVLEERLVVFPPPIAQAMEQANNQASGTWNPTPADLEMFRTQWKDLAPEGRGVSTMTNEIFAPDGYDDTIKKEPKTKDSLWVIRQLYQFAPGGARPIKQVNVVVALAKDGDSYTGTTSTLVLAAAPFPIPIKFDGTFHLIPLDAPAHGSLLARVLDFFAGCNGK
ncbi:MAG: hypothetical protein ACREQL_04305 [Candidatus Binatia bacterium]